MTESQRKTTRRVSYMSTETGEPERKMRRLLSSQSLTAGQCCVQFMEDEPFYVEIPDEYIPMRDLSEKELKEYLYETYKDEIMDRMHVVHSVDPEEVRSVTCSDASSAARLSSLESFQSTQGETMQELTFVKQRLELLEKVALVQKQYLECEGPKVVYECLLEGLLDLVDSEFGFIGEVKHDEEGKMYVHVHRATNIAWDEATKKFYDENQDNLRFYNMDTLYGRTVLEKRPVISNERATKTPAGHPFIEAYMGIPFFSETGEVIGMLAVANKPGGYDSSDVEFLDPFTATCGNIIQAYRQIEKNKGLIDTLEQKVHERTKALESSNQDLEEANRQVRKAKELQLQHFACMSHEIRTPLNCIVGLLSLLQESELSSSQKESVNLIVASSDLLSTVVDDVLDYSKLETGNVDINIKRSRLQNTLNSILHSFKVKAAAKNISLVTIFDPLVPTHIDTDPQRLQQVLFNLLGNAIKFSDENSTVELRITVCDDPKGIDAPTTNAVSKCPFSHSEVAASKCPMAARSSATSKESFCPFLQSQNTTSTALGATCPFSKESTKKEATSTQKCTTKSERHSIRFAVKDYGPGIELSQLESIFKPFKQADSETEAMFGGTGLGLTITNRLAQGLGGSVSVESRFGHFSEFTVDLPLDAVADQASRPNKSPLVFVVHDSADDEAALHLRKSLESSNISPLACPSLKEVQFILQRQVSIKSDRPVVCFCNEVLYDKNALKDFIGDSNMSLVTFGPDFSEKDSDEHFQFITHTLPSEILQPIRKLSKNRPTLVHSSSSSSLQSVKSPSNSSLRVLVAEDNKINRKVISSILKRIGVTSIDLVENGKLAVDAEVANVYDVILMDMQMPVMGGVEATRLITSRPRDAGQKTPIVVFVTANVSPAHEKECVEAGGTEFLPKPFNIRKLQAVFDTVRELCQKR